MASLTFTDGTGTATLQNGRPGAAARFGGWTPDALPIGDSDETMADGVRHQLTWRTDYLAALEIPLLLASTLDIALRLKLHLLGGGSVTVTTGDTSSRIYTCILAPKALPAIAFADRKRLWYTFTATLKNTAAAPMLCTY